MDLAIKNKADKFTNKAIMTDKISTEVIIHSLHIHNWYDHLTISPLLIITEKEVDEGIEILDEVFKLQIERVGNRKTIA